jgi:hypothetical protein
MSEAMMHAAAKPEMRLALCGDVEARREVARVGAGGFGEEGIVSMPPNTARTTMS